MSLISNPQFWQAIAWPLVAIFAFLLLLKPLKALLERENLSIVVGNTKIDVKSTTVRFGEDISQLQKEIAELKSIVEELNPNLGENSEISGDLNEISTRKRVLWVDDNPGNNVFLIESVNRDGWDVDTAISTSDALKKISQLNYNAIISDSTRYEDGIENRFAGLEFLKALQKNKNEIPILIFTGREGARLTSHFINAGASKITSSGSEIFSFLRSI
ncbi:MAG: response regulator [Beijerinckiaceae bacterium]|nr:response regulator [Beijerinckiaceae bacterium]